MQKSNAMFAKVILFSCMIILFLQGNDCARAKTIKKSTMEQRLVEFSGAPVDAVSSADSPANVLIIRSNLKGKIKIVVNKMLSMRDIKVNVIFSGFKGSNLSDHSVKYERKPGDSNTIRLEVAVATGGGGSGGGGNAKSLTLHRRQHILAYLQSNSSSFTLVASDGWFLGDAMCVERNEVEPSVKVIGKKLTRTSIIVIMTTVSTCLIAVFLAVTALVGVAFYRKYKKKKERTFTSRYDSDDDFEDLSSSSESTSESGDEVSENGKERIDKILKASSVGKNANSDKGSKFRSDKSAKHSIQERKDGRFDKRETVQQPNIVRCNKTEDTTTRTIDNAQVVKQMHTSGISELISDKSRSTISSKGNLHSGSNARQPVTDNAKLSSKKVHTGETSELNTDKSRGIDTIKGNLQTGTNAVQGAIGHRRVLKKVSTSGTADLNIDKSQGMDTNKGNLQTGTYAIDGAVGHRQVLKKVQMSGTADLNFDESSGIDSNKGNSKIGANVIRGSSDSTKALATMRISRASELNIDKSGSMDANKDNPKNGTNAIHRATANRQVLKKMHANETPESKVDKSRNTDTNKGNLVSGPNVTQGAIDNTKAINKMRTNGISELNIDTSSSINTNNRNLRAGTKAIHGTSDTTQTLKRVRTRGTAELNHDKPGGTDTSQGNPQIGTNLTHGAIGKRQVLKKVYTSGTSELNLNKSAGTNANKGNLKNGTDIRQGHQYSSDTLKIHNTLTSSDSRGCIKNEEIRVAELVIRPRGSTSEVSSCTDLEYPEKEARRMQIVEEGVDGKVDTQGHVGSRIKNLSEKGNCGVPLQRASRFGSNTSKLSGSHSLLVACLFTNLSILMALKPDLNLMQIATADITIEIPDGFFKEVQVFVNDNHKNKVTVTGDEHLFSLKVLDVASAAEVKKDKCKGKPARICDTGSCDPITGKCVCPRGYNYMELFRKCAPDCSTECPFESFMAKPCTKATAGVCKRCRSPCPPGKYESTACGGTMDRECSPIAMLPPVKIGKHMVAEDRKKVLPIHQKIYPKHNKQTVVQLNRGSGVEVVITVTEANFATIIGEVKPRYYDMDPSGHSHPICSHNVPIYYKASMRVTQEMFYLPWGGKGRCDMKNPKMEKGYLYCLGSDHNIVGIFTNSRVDKTDLKYTEASPSCARNMEKCVQCRRDCTTQTALPRCKGREEQCHKICDTTRCSCSGQRCPCYRYDVDNCNGKATACTGMTAHVINLEPVFSQNDQYCNVKMLRLATYKYRADLYVENELVISRDYHAKNHSDVNKGNVLEDDFGYLIVKMPDSPTLKNKHLLLKRAKNTKSLELGHYSRLPARWSGGARRNLAFMPARPFSISKAKWNKMKCSDIKMNAFVAFSELPIRSSTPKIFEKIYTVSAKETNDKRGFGKDIGRTFAVSKTGIKGFLDFTIPRSRSILLHIFPKSKIKQDGLYCRLLNKTSHWLIAAEGYLTSCPGSLAAKVFDQDKSEDLMFHHDFAVKTTKSCYFKFEFNIPFKNSKNREDKAFILHLIAKDQTMKFVLVREKKVERILQSIHIPKVDQSKLFNTIVAVSVIFGGFVFLIILIIIIGALTKPKDRMYQADRDNEFHFRHALVIVWFIGARLGKSIIFTFTFMSYMFVVIHRTNYHTLRSFRAFQQRERTVYRNIFQDMERHRVAEISRQTKRLTAERNICERNLQRLDSYLTNRKSESSWQQQINKKTRSIKLAAIRRARENWVKSRMQFEKRKRETEETITRSFQQIKIQLDSLEYRVSQHSKLRMARILYKAGKFFGIYNSLPGYLGLAQDFSTVKYSHKLESFQSSFNKFDKNLKDTESKQENSENLNHNLWQRGRKKSREYATKLRRIKFPKPRIGVRFEKEKAKDLFALTWIQNIVKNKIFSKIGMILMVTLDVLFFIYRHTRTYAMAVMMIYGLQKLCDLDEMEKKRQEEEEKREILRRGLPQHWQTGSSELSSSEDSNAEDRGLVGDGLTTSSDEFNGRKKTKSASKVVTASKKDRQEILDTSSTSSLGNGEPSAKNTAKKSNNPKAKSSGEDFDKNKITEKIPRQRGREVSKDSKKQIEAEEEEMPGEDFDKNKITKKIPRQRGKGLGMFSKRSNEPDKEKFSSDEESKHERGGKNHNTYQGYHPIQRGRQEPTMAKEVNEIALGVTGKLAAYLYAFVRKMKILDIIRLIALNTHLVLIFCLLCVASAAVYFTFITAKYVLQTPIIDELGFFDAKIIPILTYRKVVNTRTAANAFMVNHVWIPYYETRINARLEIYKFKAGLYKKVQCVRAVLYNSEFCSWKKVGQACDKLKPYDEDFFKNLTKYRCTMKPAFSRRYSNFDRVQFKKEMIRSYDPYIVALRGIILDTFDMVLVIICIQLAINVTAKIIFNLLLSFDMIRQIKVYQSKRPLEVWDLKK